MSAVRVVIPSSKHLYKVVASQTTSMMGNKQLLSRNGSISALSCDSSAITFPADIESAQAPAITDRKTSEALGLAVRHLVTLDDVVAFPTETVYGLGANALSPTGVSRIFSTKGRPQDNPLIVHVSSLPMLRRILPEGYAPSEIYKDLMDAFWPGPLTLLFPANKDVVPPGVTAGQPSVAVRMPAHPIARALISLADTPIAAPSANSSGKPSPTRAEHVLGDLGAIGRLHVVLDGGPCTIGVESTVVDGLNEDGNLRVLRPGGVTVEDLERVVEERNKASDIKANVLVHRRDYEDKAMESAPSTPGMKYRHYSPTVPVIMLMTAHTPANDASSMTFKQVLQHMREEFGSVSNEPLKVGMLVPSDSPLLSKTCQPDILFEHFPLGRRSDPAMSAQRLFDGLLTLDKANVQVILTEEIPEDHEGLAYMNRAKKASSAFIHLRHDCS